MSDAADAGDATESEGDRPHTDLSGRRDQSECLSCGAERSGQSYTVIYGSWDADREGFERPPVTRPLCDRCWREEYDRDAAAHWEVSDPQRLWDVLRASEGALVADLRPMFVGGRPYVRVVDGELEALGPTMRPAGENEDGTPVIEQKIKRLEEFDREFFFEVFDRDSEGGPPATALLKSVEETPFRDFTERGYDSASLGRWSA